MQVGSCQGWRQGEFLCGGGAGSQLPFGDWGLGLCWLFPSLSSLLLFFPFIQDSGVLYGVLGGVRHQPMDSAYSNTQFARIALCFG